MATTPIEGHLTPPASEHAHMNTYMHTFKYSNFKQRLETLNDSIGTSVSHPEMISVGLAIPT